MDFFEGAQKVISVIKIVECQSICIMRVANLIDVLADVQIKLTKGDNLFVFKNECKDVELISLKTFCCLQKYSCACDFFVHFHRIVLGFSEPKNFGSK